MTNTDPILTPEVAHALRDAEAALWKVSNAWEDNDQASWDRYVAAGNTSPFHMSIDEVAAQIGDFVEKCSVAGRFSDGYTARQHCLAMADLIGGTFIDYGHGQYGMSLGPWDVDLDTEGDSPRWCVIRREDREDPESGAAFVFGPGVDNPAVAAEWIIANTPESDTDPRV